MTSLAGRVAVVSGGGRGLGRAFCLALARQGASVVVNNRNRVVDGGGLGPADHVAAEITALGGSANAGVGGGGMFHRQPAEIFEEVLAINLLGSIRLARAAMAVMRPAGYGRIILVASTGGLHGDVGLSAYAASKGGLLAFGRSLAAEGASQGVLTNMLLPYALTQMTADGMASSVPRERMTAEAVAPVLTALAAPDCTLNGEYIVTGGGLLRRASAVEWETVALPSGSSLSAASLSALVAESGRGKPREFGVSVDAFTDFLGGAL
jgi:NAD(P)-dependent dehydrogenase (short-subunit alcohol dehydrogenase family)